MNKLDRWYVVSMDDGILRVEDSIRPALEWCAGLSIGRLIRTRKTSNGWREAHIGSSRTDYRIWLVGGGEVASSSGFDLDQVPLYPHADKPYERVEREK